jgi:hypothetical protein
MFPEQQGLKGDYQCVATLDSVGSIVSRTARLKVASKYSTVHVDTLETQTYCCQMRKRHFKCFSACGKYVIETMCCLYVSVAKPTVNQLHRYPV